MTVILCYTLVFLWKAPIQTMTDKIAFLCGKARKIVPTISSGSFCKDESSMQLQILRVLKLVYSRLDLVDEQVARGTGTKSVNSKVKSSDTDSDVDSECKLPSLSTLRSSAHIQRQMDRRLRELSRCACSI